LILSFTWGLLLHISFSCVLKKQENFDMILCQPSDYLKFLLELVSFYSFSKFNVFWICCYSSSAPKQFFSLFIFFLVIFFRRKLIKTSFYDNVQLLNLQMDCHGPYPWYNILEPLCSGLGLKTAALWDLVTQHKNLSHVTTQDFFLENSMQHILPLITIFIFS
jgi:hypothetical protein